MALTNAERQAAFKARKAETMDALAQQNAALLTEVAELRAEVDKLREKAHRLELAALRAQLKAQEPVKAMATKKAPSKGASKR
jgi:regulator of replication initiation timing